MISRFALKKKSVLEETTNITYYWNKGVLDTMPLLGIRFEHFEHFVKHQVYSQATVAYTAETCQLVVIITGQLYSKILIWLQPILQFLAQWLSLWAEAGLEMTLLWYTEPTAKIICYYDN